ncbi:MAG: bifunctional hydroxymethylpyrimidine kinase/phosphomethylpyrimidine kinase [Candidatus Helarchaeota archaeon]
MSKIALTIAGSDSSAGAGIQADIKTFAVHKVYGVSVVTAITAQNTTKVSEIFKIPPEIVEAQLDALLEDMSINALKTGMLVTSEIVELVVRKVQGLDIPIVVDPISKAGTGKVLLENAAMDTLIKKLIPISDLVIPNIMEAERLAGIKLGSESELRDAAEKILNKGAKAVLIKGGHLSSKKAVDFLLTKNGTRQIFQKVRYSGQDRHGSGCVLSAAITANLAKGFDLKDAVKRAERFIERIFPDVLQVGHGTPPINPLYGLF